MERFFGGNPLAVILRLILISIVAGIALKAAGFDPLNLLESIRQLIKAIQDLGLAWVENAINYFLLGAVIVVPIWFLIRLLKFISGDAGKGDAKPRS